MPVSIGLMRIGGGRTPDPATSACPFCAQGALAVIHFFELYVILTAEQGTMSTACNTTPLRSDFGLPRAGGWLTRTAWSSRASFTMHRWFNFDHGPISNSAT